MIDYGQDYTQIVSSSDFERPEDDGKKFLLGKIVGHRESDGVTRLCFLKDHYIDIKSASLQFEVGDLAILYTNDVSIWKKDSVPEDLMSSF